MELNVMQQNKKMNYYNLGINCSTVCTLTVLDRYIVSFYVSTQNYFSGIKCVVKNILFP